MGSDFLFGDVGYLSGAARTLDLFGEFDGYNRSVSASDADAAAMRSDWKAVGGDIAVSLAAAKAGRAEPE